MEPQMTETADVVVVGAGIIGLNIAFQLARRSKLKIVVVDKGASVGEGSTGASSAVCRFKYSRDEMVMLARDGIHAYQNWPDYVGDPAPLAKYNHTGALWMCSDATASACDDVARLGLFGIRAEILDDDAIRNRFPAINPCPLQPDFETGEDHTCVAGGVHFLETDAGYVEPVDAAQDLVKACRARGVEIRFRSLVTGVRSANGAVNGLWVNDKEIACGIVVNAAGPWCRDIYEMAGVDCRWPLVPTRIQIVHIKRPPEVKGELPTCADPAGGIYFRPQNNGQQIVLWSVLEEDEKEAVNNPDDYAAYADDEFIMRKLHALHHRLPGLKITGAPSSYSGLYTINQSDVHPVIGETSVKGLYAANGFSGHGFKIAPAIGSMLARTIARANADAYETEVDAKFLAFDRLTIEIKTESVLA